MLYVLYIVIFCMLVCVLVHWLVERSFQNALRKHGLDGEIEKGMSSWSSLLFVTPYTPKVEALTRLRNANFSAISTSFWAEVLGVVSLCVSAILVSTISTSVVARIISFGIVLVLFPLSTVRLKRIYLKISFFRRQE